MITEDPLEHRRYDQPEYEPFWAAAAALDLPLSLHTATRRQGLAELTIIPAEMPDSSVNFRFGATQSIANT